MPLDARSSVRIIDANINRTKEGLRVCEEVLRFCLEDRSLTETVKRIRHKVDDAVRKLPGTRRQFLAGRDSNGDVGKTTSARELTRSGVEDIFLANTQRVKESLRVLEEFSKLHDIRAAVAFKKIRYNVYEFEKRASKKIFAVPGSRP